MPQPSESPRPTITIDLDGPANTLAPPGSQTTHRQTTPGAGHHEPTKRTRVWTTPAATTITWHTTQQMLDYANLVSTPTHPDGTCCYWSLSLATDGRGGTAQGMIDRDAFVRTPSPQNATTHHATQLCAHARALRERVVRWLLTPANFGVMRGEPKYCVDFPQFVTQRLGRQHSATQKSYLREAGCTSTIIGGHEAIAILDRCTALQDPTHPLSRQCLTDQFTALGPAAPPRARQMSTERIITTAITAHRALSGTDAWADDPVIRVLANILHIDIVVLEQMGPADQVNLITPEDVHNEGISARYISWRETAVPRLLAQQAAHAHHTTHPAPQLVVLHHTMQGCHFEAGLQRRDTPGGTTTQLTGPTPRHNSGDTGLPSSLTSTPQAHTHTPQPPTPLAPTGTHDAVTPVRTRRPDPEEATGASTHNLRHASDPVRRDGAQRSMPGRIGAQSHSGRLPAAAPPAATPPTGIQNTAASARTRRPNPNEATGASSHSLRRASNPERRDGAQHSTLGTAGAQSQPGRPQAVAPPAVTPPCGARQPSTAKGTPPTTATHGATHERPNTDTARRAAHSQSPEDQPTSQAQQPYQTHTTRARARLPSTAPLQRGSRSQASHQRIEKGEAPATQSHTQPHSTSPASAPTRRDTTLPPAAGAGANKRRPGQTSTCDRERAHSAGATRTSSPAPQRDQHDPVERNPAHTSAESLGHPYREWTLEPTWDAPVNVTSAQRRVHELEGAQWHTTTSPRGATIHATFPDGTFDTRFHVKTVTFPGGKNGSGLFAARDFRKGEYLTVYAGEPIDRNEHYRRRLAGVGDHVMEIAGALIDGAVGGNGAELINSALHRKGMHENAKFSTTTGSVKALRDIAAGQEICMSYYGGYWSGVRAMHRRQAGELAAAGRAGNGTGGGPPGGAWTPVVSVYVYVYCIGASIRIRIPNIVSILHTAYVYGY